MSSLERLLTAVEDVSKMKKSSTPSDRSAALSRLSASFVSYLSLSSSSSSLSQHTWLCISTCLKDVDLMDAATRLSADETLTLLIRVLTHHVAVLNRVHVELLKTMKESNFSSKKFIICFNKFVMSSHLIKISKRRAFVVNIHSLLCNSKLASVSDEQVLVTVAKGLPKLMTTLGAHFTSEERLQLLKVYLQLLERDSVAIRRHGAEILMAFVLDNELSTRQLAQILIHKICEDIELDFTLGIINTSRLLLGYSSFSMDQLNFLYRASLRTLMHCKHQSLSLAALELLSEMLKQASKELKVELTTPTQWTRRDEDLQCANQFFKIKQEGGVDSKDFPNIGAADDDDIPLIHCARVILLKFLLTSVKGKFSEARVSCKILALDILVQILKMVPKVYLLPLLVHKDDEDIDEDRVPTVRDVILGYLDHSDPQIRSLTISLQATIVKGALAESIELCEWFNQRRPDQNDLMQAIEDVQDDSYIVQRALMAALGDLIDNANWRHRKLLDRVTHVFLKLDTKNSYWLVKIEVCNFMEKLAANSLHYYSKTPTRVKSGFREVLEVLMLLIGDEDPRVRSKAASTIVQVVGKAESDSKADWAMIQARLQTSTTLDPLLDISPSDTTEVLCNESMLFRITERLFSNIFSEKAKVQSGSAEALALLSDHFPSHKYAKGWGCTHAVMPRPQVCSAMHNLLSLLEALMTSQKLVSDVSSHTNFIIVASNLSGGLLIQKHKKRAEANMKKVAVHSKSASPSKPKEEDLSEDEDQSHVIRALFSHCSSMLRIAASVFKECLKNPDITASSLSTFATKTTLASSSSNLLATKMSQSSFYVSEPKSSSSSSLLSLTSTTTTTTDFLFDLDPSQKPSHVETLLNLYQLYLRSYDPKHHRRLEHFVEACLKCISSLLENSSTLSVSQHECQSLLECFEVILGHVSNQHSAVTGSMQALLSSIFGTNFESKATGNDDMGTTDDQYLKRLRMKKTSIYSDHIYFHKGLFSTCFEQPSIKLNDLLSVNDFNTEPARRRSTTTVSNSDKAMLASYIRLFENLVIKSLKHYTATSKCEEQISVLKLLVQLVKLRVNYCLLDSDQIFLGFVLRQLDELSRGKRKKEELSRELILQIFRLLLVLSREKKKKTESNESNNVTKDDYVVSMALIMEHMESLMPLVPYASLVLNEVVINIFEVDRLDDKRLDVPRDQCIKIALKLVRLNNNDEVGGRSDLPLQLSTLSTMLCCLRLKSEERWRKMSLAILDELMPTLIYRHVSVNTLGEFLALRKTMHSISPSCLRPVDALLESFFASRFDPNDEADLQQWLALINVVLPLVSTVSPEEGLLRQEQLNTELKLVQFIVQALLAALNKLRELCNLVTADEASMLFIRQNANYLMLFSTHLVQSGRFPRITKAFISLLDSEATDAINASMVDLALLEPFVCANYLRFLTSVHWCPLSLYQRLMKTGDDEEEEESNFIRRCLLVLMCEHLCDTRAVEVETVNWLLANFTRSLIRLLAEEKVVSELFQVLNVSSSSSSGLLLQAIITSTPSLSTFDLHQLLKSNVLENVHLRHSGQLLLFLLRLMSDGRSVVNGRLASQMACTRIEAIFAHCDDDDSNATGTVALEWVSSSEMGNLLCLLQREHIQRRFPTFVALINGLVEQCFSSYQDLSPIILSDEPQRVFGPWNVSQMQPDQQWFVNHVRQRCCRVKQRHRKCGESRMCAQLLHKISNEVDLRDLVDNKDFNSDILRHLLEPYGVINDHGDDEDDVKMNAITSAQQVLVMNVAKDALYTQMRALVCSLPTPFELFHPLELNETLSESRYSLRLETLLQMKSTKTKIFTLMAALHSLCRFRSAKNLSTQTSFNDDDGSENVDVETRFLILGLEFIKWRTLSVDARHDNDDEDDDDGEYGVSCELLTQRCLSTFASALKSRAPSILSKLESDNLMAVSAVLCLHSYASNRFRLPSRLPVAQRFGDESNRTAEMAACIKLNELFTWILNENDDHDNDLKVIVLSICRLSVFHSYVRLPTTLMEGFVETETTRANRTTIFTMPEVDSLLDLDTLAHFIYRANTLGWRSRQQFEELWVTLLSVLSVTREALSEQEKRALNQCWCLVIQALTSFLLNKTLVLPWPGQSDLVSTVVHACRDAPAPFLVGARRGRQLNAVQLFFHRNFQNRSLMAFLPVDATVNLERTPSSTEQDIQLGQVSVDYMQKALAYKETLQPASSSSASSSVSLSFLMREEALNQMQLDLHSCTRFLFDLYVQWLERLEYEESFTLSHLELMTQTIRSMVLLSDFFMDRAQFTTMRDLFNRLLCLGPNSMAAEYIEDDVLQPWLILGLSKALAVVGVDSNSASSQGDQNVVIEGIMKAIEVALMNSGRAHSKRMATHSLFYLLQASNSEMVDRAMGLAVLSSSLELRQTSLQTSLLVCSVSHLKLTWSLAFRLLEFSTEHTSWLMPLALITASHVSTPPGLYLVVMSGLQRLVVRRPLQMKPYTLRVGKLCTDLMSENHVWIVVPALQLFLALMYVGEDEMRELKQEENRDPEKLMQAMEQMSILLDCVRRSDRGPSSLFCSLLPSCLRHFLPPADLINRVVSEFLSPGQPHPCLMADVLFDVFQAVSDTQMLKEWLLMALPNLARRPRKQAVWSISCFLLAALKDRPWLQSVFPQLLLMGQESNRKLFCMAANEFYCSLNSEAMKRKFVQAIEEAAQDGPQDPFKQVLIAINPCLPD